VLYISWIPADVEKIKRYNNKKELATATTEITTATTENQTIDDRNSNSSVSRIRNKNYQNETFLPPIIEFDPDSALSNVRLRTSLMMNNPKYDHLPGVQKLKKRYK
jgi:hypothetical protein